MLKLHPYLSRRNHTILCAFSDDELKAEVKAAKASALCLGPPPLDPFDFSCHRNQYSLVKQIETQTTYQLLRNQIDTDKCWKIGN